MKYLLAFLLAACTATQTVKESATNPPPATTAEIGKAGFICDADCTDKEKTKLASAEVLVNKVFQSECFAKFFLARELEQKYLKGQSNAAILKKLQSTVLAVPVHYYYSWRGVVGYRQPPKPDIYFNRKFHNNFDACNTASNAAHEWSHSLGFEHDFNSTSTRPFSVPYSINAGFDKCCRTELK